MTSHAPTVALIHATPAAMAPARAAFADRFPEARLWNLLDDLLISDAEAAGSGRRPPSFRRLQPHDQPRRRLPLGDQRPHPRPPATHLEDDLVRVPHPPPAG